MMSGYQTTNVTYWDHGSMVVHRFRDLMGNQQLRWELPKWFHPALLDTIRDKVDVIETYQQWHDCGKFACRVEDEFGRSHYPNHAEVSSNLWRLAGGDEEVAELIAQDMVCHLMRTKDAKKIAAEKNALVLLITALCEIHANAEMFGGFESESFKIKFKRLSKCGAIIINELKERGDLSSM